MEFFKKYGWFFVVGALAAWSLQNYEGDHKSTSRSVEAVPRALSLAQSQESLRQLASAEKAKKLEAEALRTDKEAGALKEFRKKAQRVEQKAPRRRDIRQEVAHSPHSTPTSLLDWADQLAPLMTKALKDPQAAKILFQEMNECALNGSGQITQSVRNLCLQNMKRLRDAFAKKLSRPYKKALKKASPESKQFAYFMEAAS